MIITGRIDGYKQTEEVHTCLSIGRQRRENAKYAALFFVLFYVIFSLCMMKH